MIYIVTVLLIICVAAVIVLSVYLLRQKQALRKLSEQVTHTLESDDYESIGDLQKYTEGELAVLESQIGKLVILLREQAQGLAKDKVLLKNAIADMSHQLKTPMTSLHLIVSMLADQELSQEQRLDYVEHGTQLLNRIDWLVSVLLKLSRLDAGTIQFVQKRVDFRELRETVIRQIELPMELKNQELICDIQANSGFEGDFRWTAEAVLNILKNCVEHTPEGCRLYMTMTENTIYSEIVIEDEGPGIRAGEQRKIFERFYRGEHASEGNVGIGLALAADLIRHQNGTIKAENRREGGARFCIRFYRQIT
ncbi:MAG: HAMP domain-containing histidine kinase [Lachnospiraceae bacterium]|nr:HAMP domain-containing histidine kinase [Lachnospiraceae bacterium]